MLGRSKLIGDSGRVANVWSYTQFVSRPRKPTKVSKNAGCIQILQSNCRGFNKKQNALYQYSETLETMPDVIAMQDVGIPVKFRSYSTHQLDISTCILVHKQCTGTTIDLAINRDVEHTFAQILPTRRLQGGVYVLSISSRPRNRKDTFAEISHKAIRIAGRSPLVIVGDFNAYSYQWGIIKKTSRGEN
ncbi:hypothetical protein HPB48_018930 [Haemaphysalis longicornis]|uniref:Endonuclease/exonuclease/phosphatase domain-containing protein n=1 Tax=Haemaphysalis longicornis TaxID=44386 RepID=A0A9J6GQY5_HAELO|nr:hypothetical protein HPB48_018930 [Haemaphysalis longicornis]